MNARGESKNFMLENEAEIISFIPSMNLERSRKFYEGILGLKFVSDDGFANVFLTDNRLVRVVDVSQVPNFSPQPFATLGWKVKDVEKAVKTLTSRFVSLERYEGMNQDPLGIWLSPNGSRVAWFKDPDGNVLSISSK